MDIGEARRLFPATGDRAYFNTAAVGLASRRLAETYHACIDGWTASGFDFVRGEEAATTARAAVARLIGADATDIALIPSVSAAAGLLLPRDPLLQPRGRHRAPQHASPRDGWRSLTSSILTYISVR
jgi:cysteine desulfurase / selenocysteine lyase